MLCSRSGNEDCKHSFKHKTTTLKNEKMGKKCRAFFNLSLPHHHSEWVLTITVYVILYSKY